MSARPPISDVELSARIRRSMRHYRFERPVAELPVPRSGRALVAMRPTALLATAVVMAAVVTLGALAILQPWLRLGAEAPWSAAVEACRAQAGPIHIPESWPGPGESRTDVRQRLASLPFVGQERRGDTGVVILSDGRFVRICFALAGSYPGSATGDVFAASFVTAERQQTSGTELMYRWEDLDGAGPVLDGQGPIVEGGFAGPDVASVDVVRADGTRVPATLADGVWVAWWTDRVSGASVEALDMSGRHVATLTEGIDVPPAPPPPTHEAVADRCLGDVDSIPQEWRLPGEDFTAALERVRGLPLLIAHDHAGHYLFGDETYWVVCTIDADAEGLGSTSGPVDESIGTRELRVGSAAGSATFNAPSYLLAGMAGSEVDGVQVTLDAGTAVQADLVDGYWMASWQVNASAVSVQALGRDGAVIADHVMTSP